MTSGAKHVPMPSSLGTRLAASDFVLTFATQLSQSRRQNRDRELLISGSICREFRWEPEAFENRQTREQNLIQTSEGDL